MSGRERMWNNNENRTYHSADGAGASASEQGQAGLSGEYRKPVPLGHLRCAAAPCHGEWAGYLHIMRLIQQITLLLRISAAPDCMKEYEGETPLKEVAVVEALARWPDEIVAIGVRHTTVLDRYAAAIREYLPKRPLFVVTGSTVTFAKRRALREVLRDSRNGILLCTQQSLPSSVNFEFVNKIIIPEMHYNNAGMSQFYMRFVRYTSTEKKDLYFPIYIGSLESNLMQMVLAKEKLTMFMKGQDADMDEIYAKFGVDYDLLSTLMTRETDDEGHLRIHWGEQKIA